MYLNYLHNPVSIGLALILAGIIHCVHPASAQIRSTVPQDLQKTADQPSTLPAKEIELLLRQLDSEKAAERSDATRRLSISKANSPLILNLAQLIRNGSIEQQTRAGKILFVVGIRGEQSTLAKVTRTLLLLAENGHPHLLQPARELRESWEQHQNEIAERYLSDLGAKIHSQNMPVERGITFTSFDPVRQHEATAEPESFEPVKNKPLLTDVEFLASINSILTDDDKAGQHALEQTELLFGSGTIYGPDKNYKVIRNVVTDIVLDSAWRGTMQDLEAFATNHFAISSFTLNKVNVTSESFEILGKITSNSFHFTNCTLSAAGLKNFTRTREKHVQISIRPNAVLGVRGKATNTSSATGHSLDACVIEELIDGCPSKEAGIKPGDEIIKIGDNEITCFQDLVFDIAGRSVGEQITITLVRDGKVMDIEVKLGDSTGIDL